MVTTLAPMLDAQIYHYGSYNTKSILLLCTPAQLLLFKPLGVQGLSLDEVMLLKKIPLLLITFS